MTWFDNLGLRAKLLVSFVASGGVLIAAILFCILQMRNLGEGTHDIARGWLPSVQVAGEISQLRLRYRVRSLEYMLPGTPEERAKMEKSMADLDASLNKAFSRYEGMISSDAERQAYGKAREAAVAYRDAVAKSIALLKAGNEEEAQALRKGEWVKLANALRDQTDELVKLNAEGAELAAEHADQTVSQGVSGGIIALAAGILLALVVSWLVAQRVASRLGVAVQAARSIAGGDLRSVLPPASRDEVGQLVNAMGEMQNSLREAMLESRRSADILLQSSRALNQSVQQMDESATLQSAAASAIAANAEQLTVSISHVAESTHQAAALAAESDSRAQQGYEDIDKLVSQINQVSSVVGSAATRISHLQTESAKISNIVGVIKDIADQTNLLALNAAIEAARAGEHGRGFAVVADEVRKLSERTAQSTNEIVHMVSSIQQSTAEVVAGVGSGVSLIDSSVVHARSAGETVSSLRELARQVSGIVSDLNEALREQSAASTEVAQKIEHIVNHAEEGSHAAHETARTADGMEQISHGMERLVARFQV